jgi:hypothetical protein
VKEFRNLDAHRRRAAVLALLGAAVVSLLAGAYADGVLGGGTGFGAGGAGFAAYLFLFGLAFRRLGLWNVLVESPLDPNGSHRNPAAPESSTGTKSGASRHSFAFLADFLARPAPGPSHEEHDEERQGAGR